MKFIGFEREEEAERWAREKLDLVFAPEFFRAMSAVDDEGEFVCVVVMTNFTPRNIDLNIAIDAEKVRPKATIEMFNEVFGFLFDELRVARVTGLVRGKNEKSKKISEHFGFSLEGVMRDSFEGDDLHIYGFLAKEFRSHPWRRG